MQMGNLESVMENQIVRAISLVTAHQECQNAVEVEGAHMKTEGSVTHALKTSTVKLVN